MPDSALPPNLQGKKHWDWPWPFNNISRGATAFKWGKPKLIAGNIKEADMIEGAPKPISSAGTWQLSWYPDAPLWAKLTGQAFYFAKSGERKADGKFRHFRAGTRWDDVDGYSTILAFATRRFTGDDSQNTGTGPMKGG